MTQPFGPFENDELAGVLALEDVQRATAYDHALLRYRALVEHYDQETRSREPLSRTALEFLERARRNLHEQVMQIGHSIGKSEKDFFADLLNTSESRSLKNYDLPEFMFVTQKDDLNSAILAQYPESFEDEDLGAGREIKTSRHLQSGEIGIVFLEEVRRTIPSLAQLRDAQTQRGYKRWQGPSVVMEQQGDRERLRRAKRMAQEYQIPFFHLTEFSHNYSVYKFGVIVDSNDIERVASAIRLDRAQFGILLENIDPAVLEKDAADFEKYLETVLHGTDRGVYEHFQKKFSDRAYQVSDDDFLESDGMDFDGDEHPLATETDEEKKRSVPAWQRERRQARRTK